jgi:hypothetical protein
MRQPTTLAERAVAVVPLGEVLLPAATLLAGVPLLTGLALAAARYIAGGAA